MVAVCRYGCVTTRACVRGTCHTTAAASIAPLVASVPTTSTAVRRSPPPREPRERRGRAAAFVPGGTRSRSPATRSLGSEDESAEHDREHGKEHDRLGEQPAVLAAVGYPRHQPADEEIRRGVVGIDEVVVVALEREAPVVDRDDAVEHDGVQRRALVRRDRADAIVRGRPHDREIAGVKAGEHARAVRGDVGGAPAEVRRPEQRDQPSRASRAAASATPTSVRGAWVSS